MPNAKEKEAMTGISDQPWTSTHVLSLVVAIAVLAWARKLVPSKYAARLKIAVISLLDKMAIFIPGRSRASVHDPHETDSSLLKNHTTFRSYTTDYGTYPSIRTFYRPHPQADKLPSTPDPVPLLVFVHGLGGSLAQFKAVVTNFVDVAPCLGIDFPGCGRSKYAPSKWSAYTPAALAELLRTVIAKHTTSGQGFVLVGHSLGCSISVLAALSTRKSTSSHAPRALGLVAVCPLAAAPSGRIATILKFFLCLPNPIFNAWRLWNKRGGIHSSSVTNFVGTEAATELRELQVAFNAQSKTPVFRRMAWGVLQQGSLPSPDEWAQLDCPIFLIGGGGDTVTSANNVDKIAHALNRGMNIPSANTTFDQCSDTSVSLQSAQRNVPTDVVEVKRHARDVNTRSLDVGPSADGPGESDILVSKDHGSEKAPVKVCILPFPASHALLYDPTLSRTLCGLIQSFLPQHIDYRLSASWQLQHLTDSHMWDVKNLAKWEAVPSVSVTIHGTFLAMKTLREVDDLHNPTVFGKRWGQRVKAVIDISNSTPVYDPQALEEAGVEYHKFPTVSKIPPTKAETIEFSNLVDRLRSPSLGSTSFPSQDEPRSESKKEGKDLIAVHCHYGFNRTGFFVVAYLIEKYGMNVRDAVEEFKSARPPGLRHKHFINELFVRYCLGDTNGEDQRIQQERRKRGLV